jgi:hypothetical protein
VHVEVEAVDGAAITELLAQRTRDYDRSAAAKRRRGDDRSAAAKRRRGDGWWHERARRGA